MALTLPNFTYPQPRPSLIAEAFANTLQTGLQELVRQPFEKAAEKRATERQIAAEKRGVQNTEDIFAWQRNLLEQEDIATNYTLVTPDKTQALVKAAQDPNALIREYGGQKYYPRSALVAAGHENAPITPSQREASSFIFRAIGGFLPETGNLFQGKNAPETQGELASTLQEASPLLTLAGIRQAMLERLANRDNRREDRFYSLFANSDPRRVMGLGVEVHDAQGNPTGEIRPLTQIEGTAYQNPWLGTVRPEDMTDELKPYVEAARGLNNTSVVPLNGITEKELDQRVNDVLSNPTNPNMTLLIAQASNKNNGFGFAVDPKGKPLNDPSDIAAFLQANPAATRALLAYAAYPNGMNDVINANKVPGHANFDPLTLTYLAKIYQRLGLPWDNPILTPQDRGAISGTVSSGYGPAKSLFNPGGALSGTPSTAAPNTEGAAGKVYSPLTLAPPGAGDERAAFVKAATSIGNQLRADPSLYDKFQKEINDLQTPADGAKLAVALGLQDAYVALTTGTDAQKQAHFAALKSELFWALNSAYEAQFGGPPKQP